MPIFMTTVEIERGMLLSLIRNLLNAYRGPQHWAQHSILAMYFDSQTQEAKTWGILYFSIHKLNFSVQFPLNRIS